MSELYSSWESFINNNIRMFNKTEFQYGGEESNSENQEGPISNQFNNEVVTKANELLNTYKNGSESSMVKLEDALQSHPFVLSEDSAGDKKAVAFHTVLRIDEDNFNKKMPLVSDSTLMSIEHLSVERNSNVTHVELGNVRRLSNLAFNTCSVLSLNAPELVEVNRVCLFNLNNWEGLRVPKLCVLEIFYMEYVNHVRSQQLPVCNAGEVNVNHCKDLESFELNKCNNLKYLNVKNCENLVSVRAPELKSACCVRLFSNAKLNQVNLSKLETAKKVKVMYNTQMTSLDLSNLKKCQKLVIYENYLLESLNLSNLEYCECIVVMRCSNLKEIHAPKLTYVNKILKVDDCPLLEKFDWDMLEYISYLALYNVPKLKSSCKKPAFYKMAVVQTNTETRENSPCRDLSKQKY